MLDQSCAGTEAIQQLGDTATLFEQEARCRTSLCKQHDRYAIFAERHGAYYAGGNTILRVEFQRLIRGYSHCDRLLEVGHHFANRWLREIYVCCDL